MLWQDHLGDLCTAIRNKDAELARRWCKSEQWCTVIQLMQVANGKMVPTISFFLSYYFLSIWFCFFVFFLFIEFIQPPEKGPYAGTDWLSFVLLVQQLFF